MKLLSYLNRHTLFYINNLIKNDITSINGYLKSKQFLFDICKVYYCSVTMKSTKRIIWIDLEVIEIFMKFSYLSL